MPTTPHREAGSAYIIALMALAVLTILGLSVVLISQTEMQIGSNERTASRAFYAADSGIAASTARAMVTADYRETTYTFDEVDSALPLKNEVAVSAFYPLLDSPCNLCEINNAGTYNERAFRKINHAVTSTATRLAGADEVPQAQKTIASMVEFQPWKVAPQAYLAANDPEQLEEDQVLIPENAP